MTPSAACRLENLRRYLADPEGMRKWIAQELNHVIDKQMRLAARLEALENIEWTAIKAHWKTIVGQVEISLDDPDWDNALHLYYTTDKNKRLLRKLLHQKARGDRQWIRTHPPNQAFIEKLLAKGVNMDVWMESFEKSFVIHGEIWTVYAETHPLRVLQRGTTRFN